VTAADLLGIDRNTLKAKVRLYGIEIAARKPLPMTTLREGVL
jgi:DNA-binding NtrC family response regulator